jgi:hypothetical protein
MSLFGKILSAPLRVTQGLAAVTNLVTEKIIGDDIDVLGIEQASQELAEDIEELI